jgi:hypothetical protein
MSKTESERESIDPTNKYTARDEAAEEMKSNFSLLTIPGTTPNWETFIDNQGRYKPNDKPGGLEEQVIEDLTQAIEVSIHPLHKVKRDLLEAHKYIDKPIKRCNTDTIPPQNGNKLWTTKTPEKKSRGRSRRSPSTSPRSRTPEEKSRGRSRRS